MNKVKQSNELVYQAKEFFLNITQKNRVMEYITKKVKRHEG